jgi:DNA-binding PadR family transcriptional regulator
MRRSPGAILPLEVSILEVAVAAARTADDELHGFELAKRLQDVDTARRLTAHGTLYKALGRMEKAGFLESRWEDPNIAADEGRPRRRLYRVTADGRAVLANLVAESAIRQSANPGLAPT